MGARLELNNLALKFCIPDIRWNLTVALFCASLITKESEYFFIYSPFSFHELS